MLARGKYWVASLSKGAAAVVLALQRDSLPEELQDLRDLKLEVTLGRWNSVVKHVLTDRKLMGAILIEFANQKDQLLAALASDRLFSEFQRVVLEATAALVAQEVLSLQPAGGVAR